MTAPTILEAVPANLTNPTGDRSKRQVAATEAALIAWTNNLLTALREEEPQKATTRGQFFFATGPRTISSVSPPSDLAEGEFAVAKVDHQGNWTIEEL